jgi:chromosome segregation and condensation protein ScpB
VSLVQAAMSANAKFAWFARRGSELSLAETNVLAIIALNEGSGYGRLRRVAKWPPHRFNQALEALRSKGLVCQSKRGFYVTGPH